MIKCSFSTKLYSTLRFSVILPVRLGGLGIINPVILADIEFDNFKSMTESLSTAIRNQVPELPDDFDELTKSCKLRIRSERRRVQNEILDDLLSRMSADQKKVNEIT